MNTETSLVVAVPSGMQYPRNEAVERAVAKKRSRQASSSSGSRKGKGSATTTSTRLSSHSLSNICHQLTVLSNICLVLVTRSGTGSNDPIALQTVVLAPPIPEYSSATVQIEEEVVLQQAATPKKRMAIKKKLTPKRPPAASANPACPTSPASNTRSKKKLQLE